MASGMARHQIGADVMVGDVDPGYETEYCDTISGKARTIGGGVVEAIFHSSEAEKSCHVTSQRVN